VRRLTFLLALVVSVFLLVLACQAPSTANRRTLGTTTSVDGSIGFASPDKLTQHFQKHGHEFGAADETAYLKLAQELRDAPVGGNVIEDIRADGVRTRFDRGTGSFLAFNSDGTIRTFFRPSDGEAYYRRQLNR